MIDITITYRGVTLSLKCTLEEFEQKLPLLMRQIEENSTTPGLTLPQPEISTTYDTPSRYNIIYSDTLKTTVQ